MLTLLMAMARLAFLRVMQEENDADEKGFAEDPRSVGRRRRVLRLTKT